MIANMMGKMLSRGRVTIPIELRPRCEYGVTPGTRLIVREGDGRIEGMTMEQYVHLLRGKYKGKGLMKALREGARG